MKNIYYIIILLLSPIYSGESNWATTRFETFWKKNFTQMIYREPVTFLPYDIKIGYLKYGGDGYYKQFKNFFSSSDDLDNNPFGINEGTFPSLSNVKDRTLISVQLDLFRYNFFSSSNNKIDIETGVGFKITKSLEDLFFQDGDKLNPEFQEININTTAILQWRPNWYNYLYYTLGYNNAIFYKRASSNKESTGSGIGQSLGFGFDFIIPNRNKANDLHCGIEINFSKLKFDKKRIKEPDDLDRINAFNIETIGFIFSFGIGYGGKKTSGDEGYLSMLNRDYILASEQFQDYRNNNETIYNEENLSEMIFFCDEQVPYQFYNLGLEEYNNNNLESAAEILKKIRFNNDEDLNYKIESLKYTIADKILNNFIIKQDEYSINYQIQYCKSIKQISPKIRPDVDKRLFDIYLEKGDFLLESSNYEEAYKYYIHASTMDNNNSPRLEIKIDNVITAILNDVYKLLQNKQNILAYEKLSFAKDISSKNNNIDFLRSFIQDRMSSQQKDNIRDRMIDIIEGKRKFIETTVEKNIYLGDTHEAVINILGYPLEEISRTQFDSLYEMITYSFNEVEHRLFFKDKILIDIERD